MIVIILATITILRMCGMINMSENSFNILVLITLVFVVADQIIKGAKIKELECKIK